MILIVRANCLLERLQNLTNVIYFWIVWHKLVFERDIYFWETHLRVSNPQGGNLEIAMVSIANSVNFPGNPTKEQFKLSAINFVRSNYRKKSSFLHLFLSLFRSRC